MAIPQKHRNIRMGLDELVQSCTLSFDPQSPRLALARLALFAGVTRQSSVTTSYPRAGLQWH